jgi:hypothetical protein
MGSFVKIWTDILHDSWVQGLTLSEKGLWIWLITMVKEAGDSGQVSCPSWRGLGMACGCDGKTAERILRKFHTQKRIELVENENGTIVVAIPNYHYYQLIKRPGRIMPREEKALPIPQDDSSQTRSDQIRADKTIPDETKSDQIRLEQIRKDQSRSDIGSDNSIGVKKRLTPGDHEVILNAFYKKFKNHLKTDCLNTLLYGNSSFEGYDSPTELLFALNNIRITKPGSVENPVGLLIDFYKNPDKYLSDMAYADWKRLRFKNQPPIAGSIGQLLASTRDTIQEHIRSMAMQADTGGEVRKQASG